MTSTPSLTQAQRDTLQIAANHPTGVLTHMPEKINDTERAETLSTLMSQTYLVRFETIMVITNIGRKALIANLEV